MDHEFELFREIVWQPEIPQLLHQHGFNLNHPSQLIYGTITVLDRERGYLVVHFDFLPDTYAYFGNHSQAVAGLDEITQIRIPEDNQW